MTDIVIENDDEAKEMEAKLKEAGAVVELK